MYDISSVSGDAMAVLTIQPIGVAKNTVKKPRHGGFTDLTTDIFLDEKYAGALDGIDEYSHLIIVYWMHRVDTCDLIHRPQGNPMVPVVGIFACRCPQRPNPIGITMVKLLSHYGSSLKVQGLDVLDKTPILDIKPYWPQYDEVKKTTFPNWVNYLAF